MKLGALLKSKRVVVAVAAGIAGLVAVPALASKALARNRVEAAKFEVESEHEGIEIRRYAPRLVAQVRVEGNAREASSAGFRLLADYIFGNNTTKQSLAMTAPVERKSEKIAMTAPVDQTKLEGEQWTITFTMPSKYTMKTLPKPVNDRVTIRELPATRYAVQQFSGSPSETVVQKKMANFVQALDDAGIETAGKTPTYSRFDPPWTPSFMRHNEIMIELGPVEEETKS